MAMNGQNVDGVVKSFNPINGYGFVNIEGISLDVFMHKSVLGNFQPWEIQSGAPIVVSFDTDEKRGGFKVTKVHALSIVLVKTEHDTWNMPQPTSLQSPQAIEGEEAVVLEYQPVEVGQTRQGFIASLTGKGFCFIKVDGTGPGKNLFAHYTQFDPTIEPKIGMHFTFKVDQNDKGFCATSLELIEKVEEDVVPSAEVVLADVPVEPVDAPAAPVDEAIAVEKTKRIRTRIGKDKPPVEVASADVPQQKLTLADLAMLKQAAEAQE